MRARVALVLPDGREVSLFPGDLVGRSHAAALRLDDPRVSEAHAFVSLREGELRLLALRGMLAIDQRPCREVVLESGLDVHLAEGVSLGVSAVEVPDRLLALEGDGLARQVLRGPSASLLAGAGGLELRPGYVDGARGYLWSDGEGWWARIGEGSPLALAEGAGLEVAGRGLRVVSVPLERGAARPTRLRGRLHPPLRIVASYDTAALHRDGMPAVGLGGLSARILTELVGLAGPAHWSVIARELWRDVTDELPLRRRWDRGLARLRAKLREAGVRPDLIRSDGAGCCELFLYEGDSTEARG